MYRGISALFKGFQFMKENPLFFLFPFLQITMNLSLFLFFAFITKYFFGVEVFNNLAIQQWLSIEFWEKINHLAVEILLLYFFYLVIVLVNAFSVQAISLRLENKPIPFFKLLKPIFRNFKTLLKLSLVEETNLLISFFGILRIYEHLIALKNWILNPKSKKVIVDRSTQHLLILPNLIKNGKSLHYNIELSKKEFEKIIGPENHTPIYFWINLSLAFGFVLLIYFLSISIGPMQAFIVSISAFFSINHFIKFPQVIFSGVLFNYVEHKPTGIFTKEYLSTIFSKISS